MVGRIDACILLAYRVPISQVAHLVPRGLELMTQGPWAFWNVVVSRLEAMRLAGLPRWAGVSYHHVAYRLYVRARVRGGEAVDGLYFLRSDADHGLINALGNRLSDFRFQRAQVTLGGREGPEDPWTIHAATPDGSGDLDIELSLLKGSETAGAGGSQEHPAGSLLKYRPLGLCPDQDGRVLRLARVVRDESQWRERPLCIHSARFAYFERLGMGDMPLARATQVDPLEYRWELGETLLLEARPEVFSA
jgi:hypothetical protein